jgi:hypothetical protein
LRFEIKITLNGQGRFTDREPVLELQPVTHRKESKMIIKYRVVQGGTFPDPVLVIKETDKTITFHHLQFWGEPIPEWEEEPKTEYKNSNIEYFDSLHDATLFCKKNAREAVKQAKKNLKNIGDWEIGYCLSEDFLEAACEKLKQNPKEKTPNLERSGV